MRVNSAALAVAVVALVCSARRLTKPSAQRVLTLASDGERTVPLQDLVRQAPLWAPETVEPVSKGFNAWMDTLPFGESDKHRQLRKRWERLHGQGNGDDHARSALPQLSQTQMLRMQMLAPNIWEDYTMGGNGIKCVCDSAAAGDPEMEGLDPNVKPACTCTGGRTTAFSKTEEGGPLDTGGHGAWPQDLPGVTGGGDGAAYVDGIVGNNAYKSMGKDASILYAVDQARSSGGDDYAYGDDYGMIASGQRQRAFDSSYDASNDFKYRGLFPDEGHPIAPPMSGLWGSPPAEDTYEWNSGSHPGDTVAARMNAERKAQVQWQGTGVADLKDGLEASRRRSLTHPDTLGGTFGHATAPRWGNAKPGYGDPHSSRLED